MANLDAPVVKIVDLSGPNVLNTGYEESASFSKLIDSSSSFPHLNFMSFESMVRLLVSQHSLE